MLSSRASPRLISSLAALVSLLYPILVLIGLKYLPPGTIVVGFAAIVGLRVWLGRRGPLDIVLALAVCAALGLLGLDARLAVLIHPVLVNLGFAVVFGRTLWSPPPMVERIARLAEPDLPPEAAPYLRNVTIAWLCFFILNGLAALWTVVFGTIEQWTFYNGFLAYLLIGAMFGGELILRRRFMRRAGRSP
jgi:uncharacterized membrane protein